MKLPFLSATEQSVDMISQFGGYNHRVNVSENQFYDMKNMSSRDFPVISTRAKRGVFTHDSLINAQTIAAKDNIVFAFTNYGDIGVKLAESVPEGVLQNTTVSPGEEEQIKYTRVTECNDNVLANEILNKNGLASFGMYKFGNNTFTAVTGATPTLELVDEDGKKAIQVKQPHGMIASSTLWAKQVFSLGQHWYSGDKKKVSSTNNGYLASEDNRALLVGKKVYINSIGERTIVSISSSKKGTLYFYDDWIVEFDKELTNSCEKKVVYVKLTEPLASTVPAVSEEIKEDDEGAEEINKPTKVKVNVDTDSHLKVLKGKAVDFVDEQGAHTCQVIDYEIDGINRYIYIELPHDAMQTGASAYGDRLYLCEYNPFTGDAITSNIFSASDKPHTLLEMGANVVIFPEKVMVNTQKRDPVTKQFNDIQQLELTDIVNSCSIKLTDANGNKDYVFGKDSIGITAPEEPENKQGWIDTSTDPPTFKVYSSQIEQWAKTLTYCEITGDISTEWEVGDAVELDFAEEGIWGNVLVPVKEQKYFVISAVGENYIRFPVAMKVSEKTTDKLLTIKRTVPDMDFIIENENRLWGCKYGEVDGEMINEIFACKLGDPKNWHCFSNTSMDSYYVSLGADGEFTGAYTYQGSPFFFREGCIHRVYGNYPANYSLKTINCHGVEKGSNKGITVLNDVMFYKSPVGVMAYTGATPVCVTENFGTERYKNAVAGAVGNKMYFSMQDSKGDNVLFTYDDSTKLWHKEDNLRCKDMVVFENDVYALSSNNDLLAMEGSAGVPEGDFEWFVESGDIGYTTPYFKRLIKADIRLQMDRNTRASLYIQYDSSGDWHHINDISSKGDVRSVCVPVQPQRCDHFKLMLKGKGGCKIMSISKVIEGGSDDE